MINIALLSRNRPRLIQQCIESLYANTPRKDFGLVVADDGSSDFRTLRYLRSLTYPNFSLLEVQNSAHVLGRLKNLSVAWSEMRFGRGDWLYIGDGDTAFLEGWSGKMIWAASQSECEDFRLWGGQIHPYHQPMKSISEQQFAWRALDGHMTEHAILDGPSWMMRWETWDKYGPFPRDTAPGPCQSDEYPFCEKLRADGGRIGVVHPHVVAHCGLHQTSGSPAPGADLRAQNQVPGIIYE